MENRTLTVEGMHCSSCGMLIDETLEELPGVSSSSTNVRKHRTKVEFDPARTTVANLVKAIAKLGYRAEPAQ
ncbi:MAG: cation transporter [Acidimicrobiales bacterium]